MKPARFDYVAAHTVDDAVQALAVEDAKVIAGGQSLMPLLAMRLAQPSVLVDVGRVDQLLQIRADAVGGVSIGAMVTQAELADDGRMAAQPLVGDVLPFIGHASIRNRGTVGGSISHADPSAEWPALAVALGATFDVTGPGGSRTVPAEGFFEGPFMTALDEGDLLTAIALPRFGWDGWGFSEVARRAGDFAMAGAVAALAVENGRVASARIVALGVGSVPLRLHQLEDGLVGVGAAAFAERVDRLSPPAAELAEDIHASRDYRERLLRVVVGRALAQAWARAAAAVTA